MQKQGRKEWVEGHWSHSKTGHREWVPGHWSHENPSVRAKHIRRLKAEERGLRELEHM